LVRAGIPLNEAFSDDLAQSVDSVDALTEILLNTAVIACTVYSVSSNDVLSSLERHCGAVPFDVVLVDEATQLTEPLAVGALVRAKRFVLVGDPKQLPPVVTGDFEQAEHEINPMGLNGLDQSLFERLLALGIPSVRLDEQYRMNNAVMSFSNRTFYGGELRAESATGSSELSIDLSQANERVREILSPTTPVVFVDVKSAELGRTNPIEAHVISELASALLAGGLSREEIGVISPFRAQVDLMRQVSQDSVDCDTVERFQGGEREVILVSLVRTERTGAFITDERRLNVALTRARTKVIVVGNGDCLRVSPLLRDLIEQAETTTHRWDLNV
jgi:DNA replication ATP-dependent helicase Dna2